MTFLLEPMPPLPSEPCCKHKDERLVIVRGRALSNYSEDYRRYCEAKMVLNMKPKDRNIYMGKVLDKRGRLAWNELTLDVNRGV